jgi:hypothetical protein
MPKWKKGWKVIRILFGKRYSCTAGARERAVEYIKGKVVGRPHQGGPLAVFRTREHAREFTRVLRKRWANVSWPNGPQFKIVRCLYIESGYNRLWEPNPRGQRYCSRSILLPYLPAGTRLAEKVKCLE